ncbi:MAG TPA: sugar ABC transporter permease [Streptosporangiaceae bacterium]|nr:sugar ABC transporter permease [Streptosporangiaceae bacterium]
MSDTAVRTAPPEHGRAAQRARAARTAWVRRRDRRGIFFVAPFLGAFVLFVLVPLGYAVYSSVYTTRIIGGTTFAGADNYRQVLGSGLFWNGVARVVVFGAVQITIMLAIAFFFAAIFDLGLVKFGRTWRTIYFIPFAVPIVVATLMWGFLLQPRFGPFPRLAEALGFPGTNFLSENMMLPSIIVIVIWEWTGYNMIILYTALKSVPRDIVEAALIEGAPVRKIVLKIKLPMVRPAIVMLIFLNSIGASQLFVEPLILNNYQSGVITNYYTPTYFIYNTAVAGSQYNLAAAMAVILGLVVVLISIAALIFRRRKGELT